MIVTYDGTDFLGFQTQSRTNKERTVAGTLLKMLTILLQTETKSLSMVVRLLLFFF